MAQHHQAQGVELPSGHSGSSYLRELLARTAQRFPQTFSQVSLSGDGRSFRDHYAEELVRFEAARAESPERSAIARYVTLEAERELRFVAAGGEVPFAEVMAARPSPLPLVRVERGSSPELVPTASFGGKLFRGRMLLELVDELSLRHLMTDAARHALAWIVERAEANGGKLDLTGQRFVLLGAGAELAPTEILLEGGAEVLWIDVREPPSDLLLDRRSAGTLVYVKGGADLLSQPHTIARTIESFAAGAPVHLWMYAYAGGASQEWRLTASMNGIARALPRELVGSLAMLISPTTAFVVSPEDARVAEERRKHAPRWKRALARTKQLIDGQFGSDGTRVSRSIVPTQGASYQAAQYIGKILAAEACAVYGTALDAAGRERVTVSANVGPITATRSLAHPVFEAAFLGAPVFDILISKASTTRNLGGLLALHDVLNPDAPGAAARSYPSDAARARALFSQQFHGGVYAQPFALEGCITVAALRGLVEQPKLALGLFR